MATFPIMKIPILLITMIIACGELMGCATSMVIQTRIANDSDFVTKVRRFHVRVVDYNSIVRNRPQRKLPNGGSWDPYDMAPAPTQYHIGGPEEVQRVLRAKGYEVTMDWSEPWSYGANRPCMSHLYPCELLTKVSDYRGAPVVMATYSGQLSPDEAFLELVTWSSDISQTTYSTIPTETQVARVTDAYGNTIGNVYQTGTKTVANEHHDLFSSVGVQVFLAQQSSAVLLLQVHTDDTADPIRLISKALGHIPNRSGN